MKSYVFLLGGIAVTGSAFAQSTTEVLNPIIVTGSRSEIASFDAPFSVDVVDAKQIGEGQLRINASEALNRVPGLVVQNRQNYAQDLQISSRGFGSRAAFGVRGIKLFTDGIPASTPDGQGQAATFNLDTADRFEVLRGPMTTIYGSNSGGVIQMFSRDGKGDPRITAETLFGKYGMRKNRLGAEGEANGIGFVLDASRMDTDGFRDHSEARRDQRFAKITTQPTDSSTLRVVYNGLSQKNTQDPQGLTWDEYKADRRQAAPSALLYNTRKSIDNDQVGIDYTQRIGAGTLKLNAYGGERDVTQYQSIPRAVQSNIRQSGGVIDFSRRFYGGGIQWSQPFMLGGGALEVIAGLDFDQSRDDRQGYENFVGSTLGVKGALRRNEIDTATSLDPYVQANWLLGDWTLQAGLRYNTVKLKVDDRYLLNGDDSGSQRYERATPAVGAMYAITPDVHVYASAGTGFETPTLTESAYAANGAGFNAGLQPSRSEQLETGIKTRFGNTRVNAALFQIRTKDELVVAGSLGGRTTYQNAAETLRRGFELSVESQIAPTVALNGAWTYLDATYDKSFDTGTTRIDSGNRLPGVPKNSLFGEVVWTPQPWVSTALEGVVRGKVFVEDTNRDRPAPGYALLNWRTTFTQKTGPWTFRQTVRLDNLTDRNYIGSVIVGDGNGRYYEPAAGMAWYAGASVQYTF
ncbi:TonB-dependent receptor [Alcaligenaceae bacterium C4P045]|nr:TonB-dependent receptor [Alcaligenaceae bacterium C4P045]